jgi:hypothetical protein
MKAKRWCLIAAFAAMVLFNGFDAFGDTVSGLGNITATGNAGTITQISYEGSDYDPAVDLVLGTTTIYDGSDNPVDPTYAYGDAVSPYADDFSFDKTVSTTDKTGTIYLETIFGANNSYDTFFAFENNGNDDASWYGVRADGSLTTGVWVDASATASATGYSTGIGSQALSGYVFTTSEPVAGIRILPGSSLGSSTDSIGFDMFSVSTFQSTASPEIISSAVTEATVGQLYSYDVEATGSPVPTFSLITSPAGMSINPASGLIEWTPAAAGDYDVTIVADNGIDPDDIQIFTISVTEQTTPPAGIKPITSITATGASGPDPIMLTSVTIDGYTVDVADLATGTGSGAGGSATYPVENADNFNINNFASLLNPHNIVNFDGTNFSDNNGNNPDFFIFENGGNDSGSIRAIFPDDSLGQPISLYSSDWGDTGFDSSVGSQNISGIGFEIRDLLDAAGNNLTNTTVIKGLQISSSTIDPSCVCAVVASSSQTPPEITSAAVTNAYAGVLYTYDVEATGTPAPNFSLITAPAGMTIDPASGLIEWTPAATGDYDVTVTADNGIAPADQQIFTISVNVTSGEPIVIMPLGDSITKGSGTCSPPDTYLNCTGYRDYLWNLLTNAGYNIGFVGSQGSEFQYQYTHDNDHEGHGGWTPSQIDDNIAGWLNTYDPEIILLHIGTNNTSQVSDVDDILDKIDAYEATNHHVTVLLARIINRYPYHSATTTFNNAVEANALNRITNGDDIIIVDMEDGAGINYSTDMVDTLHPNAAGYEKMANLWFSHLQDILVGDCPDTMTNYWKLEESSPDYIDSIGGNDATCEAGYCPDSQSGIVGNAMYFDGGDMVTVADYGIFNWGADDSFAIEFWMKKDTACGGTSSDYNNVIVGRASSGGNHWWVGVNCNSADGQGLVKFNLNDGSASLFSTTNVIDGAWHHIIAVRDGSGGTKYNRLYVDGELEDERAHNSTTSFDYTGEPLDIGWINLGGGGYYYQGLVDEIAIYNAALTLEDAQNHYSNGLAGQGYCQFINYEAPEITSTALTNGYVGELYEYDVEASGNPEPTFSLETAPAGMIIDPTSGLIEWTPSATGVYDVNVISSNGVEPNDFQFFDIDVTEPPSCPLGMAHYWMLDETTGPYVDFYGSADLSCTTCPTPQTGQVDGSQGFNGIDEKLESNSGYSNPTSEITVMAWVNPDYLPPGSPVDQDKGIVYKNGAFLLELESDHNYTVDFSVIVNGGNLLEYPASTEPVPVGQWTHIAGTYDGSEVKVYKNGVKVAGSTFGSGTIDNTSAPYQIGHSYYIGMDRYFEGKVDEVAVFDVALTETQINDLYQQGLAGSSYCNESEDDSDGDGIADSQDNCMEIYNPAQEDADMDGIGDECECSRANLDGEDPVNIIDLLFIIHGWQSSWSMADTNRDGIVDIEDLEQLAQWWLSNCSGY